MRKRMDNHLLEFLCRKPAGAESEMVIIFEVSAFELSAVEIDDLHTDAEHERHKGIENGSNDDCGDISGDKYGRKSEEYLCDEHTEQLSEDNSRLDGRHELIRITERFERSEPGNLQTREPEIENRYDIKKDEVHSEKYDDGEHINCRLAADQRDEEEQGRHDECPNLIDEHIEKTNAASRYEVIVEF